jgi:hypothetical protein
MTHKFKIGEIVFLKPLHNQDFLAGAYIVIKRLPGSRGEFAYQVRNSCELQDRVVREAQLRRAS